MVFAQHSLPCCGAAFSLNQICFKNQDENERFFKHLADVGPSGRADGDGAAPGLRPQGLEVGAVLAGGGAAADCDLAWRFLKLKVKKMCKIGLTDAADPVPVGAGPGGGPAQPGALRPARDSGHFFANRASRVDSPPTHSV